jgi:uncharacterized membrane protein
MSDYSGHAAIQDRTMPAVTYGLYFGGVATFGLATIAGVIIAHAQRQTADEASRSHYTFLIRTFWLGLAWMIAWSCVLAVAIPFSFILIGIPFAILSGLALKLGVVWYLVRLVVGVVYLARSEPHPRPYSLLA